MNCYIIPVGGTGSRVMRAIIHVMASGAFRGIVDNIKCMTIDSDVGNGDLVRTSLTATNYNNIADTSIFRNRLEWCGVCSPIKTNDSNNVGLTMGKIENYVSMDENEKKFFDFLYTPTERDKELKGGFYTHTSIGSYYMNNSITDDTGNYIGQWHSFFDGITPNDKIVIICSMFGGTGASGVPTFARRIKKAAVTSNCDIMGLFIEPYFKSNNKNDKNDKNKNPEDEIVKTDTFSAKSKIAFEYYNSQNFHNDVFTKMYFIGEDPDKLMNVAHHIDSSLQKNKANVIELYGATAVIDFLSHYSENGNCNDASKLKVAIRGTDKVDYEFNYETLNCVNKHKVFNKLCKFFQFSVLYTKFFYHCIINDNVLKKDCAYLYFYNFKNRDGSAKEEIEKLFEYCQKYINWFRELETETPDFEVYAEYDEEWVHNRESKQERFVNWFAFKDFALYDFCPIDKDKFYEKCKVLDKFTSNDEPGFPKMIHKVRYNNDNKGNATYIFECLCNQKKVFKNNPKSTRQFIGDVQRLLDPAKEWFNGDWRNEI